MSGLRCLIVVLATFLPVICPAYAKEQGWLLEQTSEISGKQEILWKTDAVRVSFEKNGLIMITKAPDWKVDIFSPYTKRYCQYTFEQFKNKFCQEKQRHKANHVVLKGKKTQTIIGLRVTQYLMAKAKKSGVVDWSDSSELWVTKQLTMPQKVSEVFAEMASLPKGLGVPLRVLRIRNNGLTVRTINTLALHKTAINDSSFKMPTGYKRVSDELGVMLEEDAEGLIAEEANYLTREAEKRNKSITRYSQFRP
jgi:hypothetical protein